MTFQSLQNVVRHVIEPSYGQIPGKGNSLIQYVMGAEMTT